MPDRRDDIPGVILAGGMGRRMGGVAKGLLPLAGRPILDHVIARFGPQVSAIALNANDPVDCALPRLPDPVPGSWPGSWPDRPGPLAGVLAAMHWAADRGATHVATVPWDAPFLPVDLVARLADATDGPDGAAIAATRHADLLRAEPVFAVWPVAARGTLQDWLTAGQFRVGGFAQHLKARQVGFDPAGFFNVNTPDDLARAESLIDAV